MSRFGRILVYVQSEDAERLAPVVRLAARHDSQLVLCDVVEAPPCEDAAADVGARLHDLRWREAIARLQAFVTRFRDWHPLEYVVLNGRPFTAVGQQVMREGFDLLVHLPCDGGRRADGGLDALDMHFVRKCPCPVWVLRASGAPDSGPVVLAVDRDIFAGAGVAEGLARDLAGQALEIAHAHRVPLHIVHAWEVYGEALLDDPRSGLDAAAVAAYVEAQRASHERWLQRLRDAVGDLAEDGVVAEARLVRGAPGLVVPEFARECGASLLVIGSIGTGSRPGLLIGTTAESILARVEVPVLALKPPGFRSPLFTDSSTEVRVP